MSRGITAVIAAGIVGAVGWALWRTEQEKQAPRVQYVRTGGGRDTSGLFDALFDTAFDLIDDGTFAGWGGNRQAPTPSKPSPVKTSSTSRGGGSSGLQGLRDLIGSVEAPKGYDQVYGGSKIRTPKPLTDMTVREVLAWQDRSVANGSASSAAGRYQFIRGTLRSLVSDGTVSLDEKFDAQAQDRAADALIERRGLSSYRSGRISAETFGQRLSQEWASLPAITKDRNGRAARGQSYYAGDGLNKSLVSKADILAKVRSI